MTDDYYIYLHWRLDVNKVFYVGKGKYSSKCKYKRSREFHNRNEVWKRVVSKNKIIVEIYKENLSEKQAFDLEIGLISKYRSPIHGCFLTNLTDGGDGSTGAPRSVETREKLARAQSGKRASLETREKMSCAAKGRVVSDATRVKLRLLATGRTCSAETKLKLSIVNKGKKLSHAAIEKLKGRRLSDDFKLKFLALGRERKIKPVVDVSTGIVFDSLVEAARASGYSSQTLSRYLRGDRSNKTTLRYV